MRLKLIACKALYREFSFLTAASKNFIDATYLKQGLHDTPAFLNEALREEIRKIDLGEDLYSFSPQQGRDFDAILLGYGLCSNGIVGLSSQKYKIVVPKTDDCIALILGSYRQYKEYFDAHCGTYWYTPSWIENAYTPSLQMESFRLEEYTKIYGEDNAKYLVETEMMIKNYNRAAYAAWDEISLAEYETYTKEAAEHFGWEYDRVKADKRYLEDFINGKWDERFLVAMPGQRIEADYDGNIIKAV